ncbi:MAG TPA: hypothetical protein VEQ42_03325, partial [Pyrinomonadaceae bacterium]|nr:hypothetical protein [Pyrinomonadaceae bacterium]
KTDGRDDAPRPALPRARRERLARLLVGKSVLETLFVVALATGFHYAAFNPHFRGSVDRADARTVEGWAVDESAPDARVEVQLYLDGRHAGVRLADRPRPDVRDAGRARDERHGFSFDTPPLAPGEHEARVYAVHASGAGRRRTLRQIGPALRFTVAPKTGEGADAR